jgi:uncharacterized protein YbaP (TraB family)
MRLLLVVLIALLGCRSEQPPAQPKPNAETTAALQAGSAQTATTDPWAIPPPSPDDVPSLTERNRIANEACPTVKGAFFYRIEKAGKVSHILGTRHIGVSLAKFPKVVHDAIASAKLAVFEVAPDDDSDILQPRVALRDELGPELWKKFRKLIGDQAAQDLEVASPSLAVLSMMVLYEDISATLDVEIQQAVAAANIPTRGLERSEFQDRLLNKVLDLRMLRAAVSRTKDREEIARESREDLAEYCAGTDDKPGMDDDMREDLRASGYTEAEMDQIDEEMVHARNEDWIPKLEKILQTPNVFIAVGADHLTGPRGVVALLGKRGYKLTRVTK